MSDHSTEVPVPALERNNRPSSPPQGDVPDAAEVHLESPDLLLNRELTWLAFNRRVLHEAEDSRSPLLERLKFLAIASSSLDEFVMKRIGGLKQQVAAGVSEMTVDGRSPRQQIEECYAVMRALKERAQQLLTDLRRQFGERGIQLTGWDGLSARQRATARDYYMDNVFPLVTPQAMDPAHPFPFISNLSLNLLVSLRHAPDDPNVLQARVKVPVGSGIPRLMQVESQVFVPLEEIMAANLDALFPAMIVERCEFFRVTRNANTERDEDEADDLLALIETELKDRKFAPIVRLEIARGMASHTRGFLAAELGLDEAEDVFDIDGMLGLGDLMELMKLDLPELKDPPHHPVDHPAFDTERNLFHVIRDRGSVLVHHPYQSFATSVESFLEEAANDPKVRAIKATIYRTAEESKIVKHLMTAARNGKQVAVVVELKARFDEEANIRWASRLESVGIHVTYGVVGLKTHCKVMLVIRNDFDGLRRYAHLGTGNYHSGTARLYGDLGLFTSDPMIGKDLTELFNYLTTGYTPARDYAKLLPAPKRLKAAMLAKIRREGEHVLAGRPGLIRMKMNALEDVDVSRALYHASRLGVRVELIVRDTCRVRPGIPGLSENIRVVSVVGRFLEHARIFYFQNAGDEEYYIGSADCMQRNLESRVETVVPVEEQDLREELRFILEAQLNDERSAWELHADGSYEQLSGGEVSSQQLFIERAELAHREATELRNRKTRSVARRNFRK